MRSNMTGRKRVAASVAATALLAGGMALAAPGAASAAPVLGSADQVTGFVNGIGLWTPAYDDTVTAPTATVDRNPDGTVNLKLAKSDQANATCGLAILPALDTPPDGTATNDVRANAMHSLELGVNKAGPAEAADLALDPGLYALVSHCAIKTDGVQARTANQPVFFATLGALGEMS